MGVSDASSAGTSDSNSDGSQVRSLNKDNGAFKSSRFISFEGTEGVGKTTAINGLCDKLNTLGIAHVRTREPGGSEFAERLRALLLDPKTTIHDDTELLLMFAARSDHLHSLILPALAQGKWVVCDRFTDSTVAYQGFGRAHGSAEVLAKIEMLIAQFVPRLPDTTLWLDLPVAEGMARAGKRSAADRFEQEAMAFFGRVYEGFAYLHEQNPQRVQRVDASGSADEVSKRIWQALS